MLEFQATLGIGTMSATPELLAKLSRRFKAVEGISSEELHAKVADGPRKEAITVHTGKLKAEAEIALQAKFNEARENVPPTPLAQLRSRRSYLLSWWKEQSNQENQESSSQLPVRKVSLPQWCTASEEHGHQEPSTSQEIPLRRNRSTWCSSIEGRTQSEPHELPRRISLPPWCARTDGSGHDRYTPLFPWQCNSNRGRPTAAGVDRDPVRQLQRLKLERDAARQEVVRAEQEAKHRNGELDKEAARLRQHLKELKSELKVARGHSQYQCHSAPMGEELDERRGQLHCSREETQRLVFQLQANAVEQSALKSRLCSLTSELERQVADRTAAEEQLEQSRASESLLRQELAALRTQAAEANSPNKEEGSTRGGSSSSSSDHGALDTGFRRMPSKSREANRQMTAPQPEESYNLDTNTGGQNPAAQSGENGQLEFEYEWGLELAGRMPVSRALQLARWAASTSCQQQELDDPGPDTVPAGEARPHRARSTELDEHAYDAPIAELEDALRVLQEASARNQQLDPLSEFDEPIADLQALLDSFCDPDGSAPTEVTAEADDFSMPVAALQEAISRLSVDHDKSPVGDVDRTTSELHPSVEATSPAPLLTTGRSGLLMNPIGSFTSAQALIRRKFATSIF